MTVRRKSAQGRDAGEHARDRGKKESIAGGSGVQRLTGTSVPLEAIVIGLQPGFACQPTSDGSGVAQLRTNNVSAEGRIDLSEIKRVPATAGQMQRYLLAPEDILFNNTNSPALVGKTAYFDEPGEYVFSNHMTRIRTNRRLVEPRYLARFLHWAWAQGAFRSRVTQWVNQAAINRSQLASVRVPLPPPSEQRRIVEILDQADRLRRLRAEADAKADRILPALFIKMFGDPATNPMGWSTKQLGQIAKTSSGGTPSTKRADFYGGDIPWVKSGELSHRWVIATSETITEDGLRSSSAKWCEPGTILIAMYGATVGQVSVLSIRATTNQAICAIETSREVIRQYLAEFLRRSKDSLLLRRVGGAQPNVSQQIIRSLEVPIPPRQLQERFSAHVDASESLLTSREQAREHISQLFLILLDRAFSGSLTDSWRQSHVEEIFQEMEHHAQALAASTPPE